MARKTTVSCDRCGGEIDSYDIKMSSARIDLWGVGEPRSYSAQRIDLCCRCYEGFVRFLEGGTKNDII